MSSEIQENFVTESDSLVHVQRDEIPTGDLLDFAIDNFAEQPSSTTEGSNTTTATSATSEEVEGVEEVSSSTKDVEDRVPSEVLASKKPIEDEEIEEVGSSESTTDLAVDQPETELQLKSPLAKCLINCKVSPLVLKVIYWDNVCKSAGIFGGALFLLLSMYSYTLLSVVTNFGMAVLAVAFLYRIGMTVVNAVQKTSAEHPFKNLLEEKIEVNEEMVDKIAKCIHGEINCTLRTLQKLFLVEDVFQSLKFGVILWSISYVGSWISPLTVAIMALFVCFTAPRLYEEKQELIDRSFALASLKMKESVARVESKIPEKVMSFVGKDKTE